MQQQLKNIPGYYEGIVAEGDQGEFFGAIDRILQKHPAYVDYLKDLFLNEEDEDRKEILGIILEARKKGDGGIIFRRWVRVTSGPIQTARKEPGLT